MEEVAEDRTSEKRSGKEEKTIKERRKGGTFTLSDYQSTCCCRGREGERERWNEWRERMAMDWPTHPPPALVPAVVSAGAVLVSHYVFNAAAQIPDPAVRLFFL